MRKDSLERRYVSLSLKNAVCNNSNRPGYQSLFSFRFIPSAICIFFCSILTHCYLVGYDLLPWYMCCKWEIILAYMYVGFVYIKSNNIISLSKKNLVFVVFPTFRAVFFVCFGLVYRSVYTHKRYHCTRSFCTVFTYRTCVRCKNQKSVYFHVVGLVIHLFLHVIVLLYISILYRQFSFSIFLVCVMDATAIFINIRKLWKNVKKRHRQCREMCWNQRAKAQSRAQIITWLW